MNAFSDLDDVLDLSLHIEDMERKYFLRGLGLEHGDQIPGIVLPKINDRNG